MKVILCNTSIEILIARIRNLREVPRNLEVKQKQSKFVVGYSRVKSKVAKMKAIKLTT